MKFEHAGQRITIRKRPGGGYEYELGNGMSGPAGEYSEEEVIRLAKKVAESQGKKVVKIE